MSIEELWDAYHFRISSYFGKAMRREWGQDTVDDLVSTTFSRACVAIHNGNGCRGNPEAWIFTIARNVLRDHFRSLKYRTFVNWDDLAEESSIEPTPLEAAQLNIFNHKINRAIGLLPYTQEQTILLRLQGYSNNEIAKMLDTTEAAVRALNTRAYANLREWLKDAA